MSLGDTPSTSPESADSVLPFAGENALGGKDRRPSRPNYDIHTRWSGRWSEFAIDDRCRMIEHRSDSMSSGPSPGTTSASTSPAARVSLSAQGREIDGSHECRDDADETGSSKSCLATRTHRSPHDREQGVLLLGLKDVTGCWFPKFREPGSSTAGVLRRLASLVMGARNHQLNRSAGPDADRQVPPLTPTPRNPRQKLKRGH